ncbi:MAG: phenylacetate--CoA ligase family protein [Thaumarchaeota archaeon]|nr:phenylacetate--CoA ligase family protein [Nitrososphaerota archaeon]
MDKLRFSERLKLAQKYLVKNHRVERNAFLPSEEITRLQFKAIKKLINLAYEKTSFYRSKYKRAGIHPSDIRTFDDFQKIPTVTKDEIIAHYNDCIVRREQNARQICSYSSGSSGKVLKVMLDPKFFIDEALVTMRMYRTVCDYRPFDRLVYVYTSEYPFRSIGGLYRSNFVSSLASDTALLGLINKVKPTFLAGYPSVLEGLVQIMNHYPLRSPLKAVFTNSEHSSQIQRDRLAEALGAPVFDEYSSEELSRIAFQCKERRYHIQEDCSYIEVLREDCDLPVENGQVGEIVGTCLINNIMPFIRYRQGDSGSIISSDCPCGQTGRILSQLDGRMNSSFVFRGQVIPSGKLLDWTYKIILEFKIKVEAFRLIQTDAGSCCLELKPEFGSTITDRERQIIQLSFSEFLSELGVRAELNISIVTSIPRSATGKRIPIVNAYSQAGMNQLAL